MTKEPEDKIAETKKNARAASKKKAANDIKRAADKIVLKMGAALPAGEAKTLIQVTQNLDKLDAQTKAINLAKRGERAKLKEMKIPMKEYDHVRKLRAMEPEDVRSFKANTTLLEQQLMMDLSPEQKEIVKGINEKREAARNAMASITGAGEGKEVGSKSAAAPANDLTEQSSAIPERNDSVGGKYRPVSAAAH